MVLFLYLFFFNPVWICFISLKAHAHCWLFYPTDMWMSGLATRTNKEYTIVSICQSNSLLNQGIHIPLPCQFHLLGHERLVWLRETF